MRSSTMAREHAEHFCPWNPNAAGADAFDGGVDVGVGIDDDRVLAAHLEDGALDPDLAGSLVSAARLLMCSPTSFDPVNAM